MCAFLDLCHELQLGPAEAPDSADIPRAFLCGEISFEDHDVLRPADLHRCSCYLGSGFIREAHASRGEALFTRLLRLQIRCRGDGRALFHLCGNQPSQFPIQPHLRQGGRERSVDSLI